MPSDTVSRPENNAVAYIKISGQFYFYSSAASSSPCFSLGYILVFLGPSVES